MGNRSSVAKSTEPPKTPKVVVVFPAKNEAETIQSCIAVVKQSTYEPAIIVADGHSMDKTREIASENGAEVVMPEKRLHPGKGAAMKTGLRAALEKNPAVIVFLDADIKNLTVEWIDKLVKSILEERYDMARGMYLRHPRDAGVTKIVAKPLLSVFFPEVAHFDQPLSGEVAAKAEVWKELLSTDPPDGWGVDVWFLIEAAMRGYRIHEVFLGTKDHTSLADYAEDLARLSEMGEQVALSIIREAIKYERIDNVKTHSP